MKIRNILLIPSIAATLLFGSCTKDFLEVQPKGLATETSYFKNANQMWSALTAIYSPLDLTWHNNDWCITPMSAAGAADECLGGGGGEGDFDFIWRWDNFSLTASQGPSEAFWYKNFLGVSRANVFLSKIGNEIPDLSDALKVRYTAEAKFLRAQFYFELVTLFKNIPFFTTPITLEESWNQPQVDPKIVWDQIEKDLKDAVPALPITVPATTEGGRITQGAAKAMLAKVIMYRCDLLDKSTSRMTEAANLLEEVNKDGNDYGYALQANYPDVFSPNNKFNSECIFDIVHTSQDVSTFWNENTGMYGNMWITSNGPRGFVGPGTKYAGGWGATPVEAQFANDMKGDPRYNYCIVDIASLVKTSPGASYQPGFQDTGYFIEKWAATNEFKTTAGGTYILRFPHNQPVIRLADTYLLEAEALVRSNGDLTKAAKYLNAVRARVGLPAVAATMDNIKQERKYELAFEGIRWFDLVRWGDGPTVLGVKGFKAGTNEIIPIPLNETYNTVLKQNPNYQ